MKARVHNILQWRETEHLLKSHLGESMGDSLLEGCWQSSCLPGVPKRPSVLNPALQHLKGYRKVSSTGTKVRDTWLKTKERTGSSQILQQPLQFSLCPLPCSFSVLAGGSKKSVVSVPCHGLGWSKACKILKGHYHHFPSAECLSFSIDQVCITPKTVSFSTRFILSLTTGGHLVYNFTSFYYAVVINTKVRVLKKKTTKNCLFKVPQYQQIV